MPLPKLKYIAAPSVDFMLKQSYPDTEEEDPSTFVLPMPQSIRVNLVCRGALVCAASQKLKLLWGQIRLGRYWLCIYDSIFTTNLEVLLLNLIFFTIAF